VDPIRHRPFGRLALLLGCLALGGCNTERIVLVEPAIWTADSSIFLVPAQSVQLPVSTVPAGSPFQASSESPAIASVVKTSSGITITGLCVGFGGVVLSLPEYPGTRFEITVEVEGETGDCAV
jgi:hypothetical protein